MDALTADIIHESRKRQTALAIHKFAAVHALTAGVLAQTEFGDEVALTLLTCAMEKTIVSLNGGTWTGSLAASIAAIAGGFVLGNRGAALLYKWIPGIGNVGNAFSSAATTEVLGWVTYVLIDSGLNPNSLSEYQKKNIFETAKKLSESEKDSGKNLYKKMSKEDKRQLDLLIKSTKSQENPKVLEDIIKIIAKYS